MRRDHALCSDHAEVADSWVAALEYHFEVGFVGRGKGKRLLLFKTHLTEEIDVCVPSNVYLFSVYQCHVPLVYFSKRYTLVKELLV